MSKPPTDPENPEKAIPHPSNLTTKTWEDFWFNLRFIMMLAVNLMYGWRAYTRRFSTWEATDSTDRSILTGACLAAVAMPILLYFTYYLYFDLRRKDRAKAVMISRLAEGGIC